MIEIKLNMIEKRSMKLIMNNQEKFRQETFNVKI